jgi:hypothetical protein
MWDRSVNSAQDLELRKASEADVTLRIMKKRVKASRNKKTSKRTLRGFRGGDPVAIGRLGGLKKAASETKKA